MDAKLVDKIGREIAWPAAPYRGLNFYAASDSVLFCERDDEIAACAKLVGRYDTKMLLLHGRTGTGKSSFLRSGLFPRVFLGNSNFHCLTDRLTGEPVMVRSTSDPVGSIIDTLHTHLSDPAAFPDIEAKLRERALSLLECKPAVTERERATRLAEALKLVTSQLAGTLLLPIDQAEEIFTLDSRDNAGRIRAYFEFLEGLCYQCFDMKVLLVLRTEYYGQFADNFRIGPDLTVTKIHSGLDQFMLHGIQDAVRLESAILRPTLETEVVAGLVPPHKKYGFTFEHGLARTIAADVVKHCGESSSLPVVQMVCMDLYSAVKTNPGRTVITHDDYRLRGGVEGAIDRFITGTIEDCMTRSGWDKSSQALDNWRDVLGMLVARQEGGALTSLLLPEKELVRAARALRMKGSVESCLREMAQERSRLLRSVNLRQASSGAYTLHYSLGHDALAPSLFQWTQERVRIREEQERARQEAARVKRVRRHALILVICSAAAFIGATAIWLNAKTSAMNAVLKSIDTEPQVRLRLLTLAALMKNTAWYFKPFLPMEQVQSRLRATLHAAPVLSEDVVAAGFSMDGRAVALVHPDGTVSSTRFDPATRGPRTTAVYGKVPLPTVRPSPYFAVGYVGGLSAPVVFNDDRLYYTRTPNNNRFEVSALPAGEKSNKESRGIPDFGGNALRLTTWRQGPNIRTNQSFQDFTFDDARKQFVSSFQHSKEISFGSRFAPVYAETSALLAFTERDEISRADDVAGIVLYLASRDAPEKSILYESKSSSPEHVEDSGTSDAFDRDPVPGRRRQEAPFVPWSLAFLPDGNTMVYRDRLDRFNFIHEVNQVGGERRIETFLVPLAGTPGSAESQTETDLQAQERLAPLRPQWPFARPALAAVGIDGGYRVAWLTEAGILVFHSEAGGTMAPLEERSRLIGALRPVDSFTRLRFSGDGEVLLLSQLIGDKVTVRVWDVSNSRDVQLNRMNSRDLVQEACKVTRSTLPGAPDNRMSAAELDQLPTSWQMQPCS